MRADLKLIPCLAVGLVIVWQHERMAQTWAPMLRLILISLGGSALIAWWFFHLAERERQQRRHLFRTCLAVFVFFGSWILFWAVAEEGLIAWTLAEYGPDDTGGRYFYPGHSGMGSADGLSSPLNLVWKMVLLALPAAWLIGAPLAFSRKTSRQFPAPNHRSI